jgi:uncharacterized radical SAM protein YgiQ
MTSNSLFPFLPTTPEEVSARNWDSLDVILVNGDSYIDSPFMGIAVIGRVLEAAGLRVGIIAQPDVHADLDIKRLGQPRLFWGISAGSVDSMIANHTALGRPRRKDDLTPGGANDRRPDRACIAYTNLIRRNFKNTRPIVLGGIEASLRRIAHYDYWSNSLRRSVLFDAKADFLLYGMAEHSIVELAKAFREQKDVHTIRGLCFIAKEPPAGFIEIPAYEQVVQDKQAFIDMFHIFYHNQDPLTAKGLAQKHGDRYLVHNPPAQRLAQAKLDGVYALPYQRAQHPYYEKMGPVKALETVRFSINSHRGCYGECNFCAIAVHEGRTVQWRSQASILEEAESLTHLPDFKGYILDIGGPTANMYGFECSKKIKEGACEDKRCIYPIACPALKPDHQQQISLLRKLRQIPGVKKVFVGSGIRYDLIFADQAHGDEYLKEIVEHHVSGQLKVAPEHSENRVLAVMGKPGKSDLLKFKQKFDELSQKARLDQYLTYYLIAAHPGCSEQDMRRLQQFASQELHIHPEQVQIFTPSPSTYSSLMYYTEMNPFSRWPIFVEKNESLKEKQKEIVTPKIKAASAGSYPKKNFSRRNRKV